MVYFPRQKENGHQYSGKLVICSNMCMRFASMMYDNVMKYIVPLNILCYTRTVQMRGSTILCKSFPGIPIVQDGWVVIIVDCNDVLN